MNTMGIGVGDLDRDGDLDMALSNITANKLLRNDGAHVRRGPGGRDRPPDAGRRTTESITWGAVFGDLNLDGWEDLYFAAGNLQQAPDVPVGVQPNELFVNDGTGRRFLDVSAATGADDAGDSKGVAVADYDRDGDLDVFVVNQGGRRRAVRNVDATRRQPLARGRPVEGTASNRDGCGAAGATSSDRRAHDQVRHGVVRIGRPAAPAAITPSTSASARRPVRTRARDRVAVGDRPGPAA